MFQTETLERLGIQRNQTKLSGREYLGEIGGRHAAPSDVGIESTLEEVRQRRSKVEELIRDVGYAKPKMRQ